MIKSKSGMIKNIVLLVLLVLVIVSNFFSSQMEILLKLKPNITNSFETQVHFIDVGQGDAIAIRFSNGKTMLIDSGTKEYKHKLQYYLDNVVLDNTKTLDYVLLTHPDVDHSGNMEFILNNYNVKEFFRPEIYEVFENKTPYCENLTYRQIIQTLNKLEIPTKFSSEQSLSSDGININILSVLGTYHDLGRIETNEF